MTKAPISERDIESTAKYITDPTVRNILIEGTYEDGYFPTFFDIDRLTSPGRPLLEVLEKLRRSEIGNDPSILLSGYVSTLELFPTLS